MYEKILKIAKETDSFYLYDESVIKRRIENLKGSFKGIEFLYSIKCNPNSNVLKTVFGCGLGADAASLNEVKTAARAGLSKDEIYYSAPGKSGKDIRESLGISTIIADSISEIERISDELGNSKADIGIQSILSSAMTETEEALQNSV